MSEVEHLFTCFKTIDISFLYCPWPIFNFSLLIYRNSLHIKAINLIPVICIAMLPSLPFVPWFMTFVYKEINEFSNSLYLREHKINHREGNGKPLQCSWLENPMDREAWWAAVPGVTGSRTWLSDFIFTFHSHALEKEMATLSSVLAWRIPGMGEPGGLPSMGLHRVGRDWSDLAATEDISRLEKDFQSHMILHHNYDCYHFQEV